MAEMNDLDVKIVRRLWLNQVLTWILTGMAGGVVYSRSDVIALIANDESVRVIPERDTLLKMLMDGVSYDDIEVYLRKVL